MAPAANAPGSTTTKTVAPGLETGIFYIPVSNLPWHTSWNHLKDFVRTVCEVDRVEIFPGSTSGWVRVRGHENFKRAFELLNGGAFFGRALIADDKNEKSPIVIKDLKFPQPEQTLGMIAEDGFVPYVPWDQAHISRASAASAAPAYSDAASLSPGGQWNPAATASYVAATATQYAPCTSAAFSPVYGMVNTSPQVAQTPYPEYAQCSVPIEAYSPAASPSPHYAASSDSQEYTDSQAYSTDCFAGQTEAPHGYYGQSVNSMPPTAPRIVPIMTPATVATEQRSVHLRNLPHSLSMADLHQILRNSINRHDYAMIVSMDIPAGTRGRVNRGHAVVLFATEGATRVAVQKLKGMVIEGRPLSVSLETEDVTVMSAGVGPEEGMAPLSPPVAENQAQPPAGYGSGTGVHHAAKQAYAIADSDDARSSSVLSLNPTKRLREKGKGKDKSRDHGRHPDGDRDKKTDKKADKKESSKRHSKPSPAPSQKTNVVIAHGSTSLARQPSSATV